MEVGEEVDYIPIATVTTARPNRFTHKRKVSKHGA